MDIIIDIGNTMTKIALIDGDNWTFHSYAQDKFSKLKLLEIVEKERIPDALIISAVAAYDQELFQGLEGKCRVMKFDSSLKIPVSMNYQTPETLGNDRLANVCALFHRYPGDAALCIDCGTCVKFDVVDATGKYLGGSISPGINLRFKALHDFTAQLPDLTLGEDIELIGNSTVNSMQSGVFNGVIHEIDGMINQYEHLFPGIKKVLTGGDAELLAGKLKSSIFVAPNLTMQGLKVILDHNR